MRQGKKPVVNAGFFRFSQNGISSSSVAAGGLLLGSRRFPVLAAQEFELPRPDLDGAVVAALVVLPLAVLELPAYADPGALRAVLADDLRQALAC